MKTRMVGPAVLWLAGAVVAAEPPKAADPAAPAPAGAATRVSPTSHATDTSAVKPPRRVPLETAAEDLGVTAPELKRLRALGFADSEVAALTQVQKRTPREMITEREVLNDVGKGLDEANARVYQMPPKQAATERDRALRAVIAKVRRDHHASREELRRILSGTSYLTADELKRFLGGPGLFGIDDLTLKRVGWPGQ
jgi:hypothetical protein